MANKQSVQRFGEQFLATIQGIQKRKQEQDEFNREMQFRNRQLNLLNTRIEVEKEQQARLQRTQDLQTEQAQVEFEKDFVPLSGKFNPFGGGFEAFSQAPPGSIQTGKQIKESKPILGEEIGKGFFANQNLIPEAPEVDLTKAGTGQFGSEEFATFFDPATNKTTRIKIGDVDKTSGSGLGGDGKQPEGKALKQFEINSLNALENPKLTVTVTGEDGVKRQSPMNPSEAKTYLFDNWNVVLNAHLKNNEALGWIKRYAKRRGWIPSTTEIANAINDDKNLSDVAVNQLVDYLEVHRGMNPGLIKIQQQAGTLPK